MLYPTLVQPADAPFVYFLTTANDDLSKDVVKIGTTGGCPLKRIRDIAPNSPVPLYLHAVIPYADRTLEAALHVRFASCRSHGEWFRWTPEIEVFLYKHGHPYGPNESSSPLFDSTDFVRTMRSQRDKHGLDTLADLSGLPASCLREWTIGVDLPSFRVAERVLGLFGMLDRFGMDALRAHLTPEPQPDLLLFKWEATPRSFPA